MSEGGKKLVTLEAKDGRLEEPMEARLLLPSDLLKSMLPEDRECCLCCLGCWVCGSRDGDGRVGGLRRRCCCRVGGRQGTHLAPHTIPSHTRLDDEQQ